MTENTSSTGESLSGKTVAGCSVSMLQRLARPAVVVLAVLIVLGILLSIARAAVYKIRPNERGIHLRGGRFVGIDEPGWHFRIPGVDTVIGITISERQGDVEQLSAMTSDDVTMDVSLLFTYRVTDPEKYALEVQEPDRIVSGFVQGKLRDVVNTLRMDEVMHNRAEVNGQLIEALREREAQYGVQFVTVQLQNALPPQEVLQAIKDRMVAVQQQEQAQAEAAQRRTVADADLYAAQKQADGEAYQIVKLAEAESQRIDLTSRAQQEAMRAILLELEGKGALAEQYIHVLIAQELRQNSKWIISGGETVPVVELRETIGQETTDDSQQK